jgi:hypothetical protein
VDTYQRLTIEELATLAGVPLDDAQAWATGVRRWMSRGYALEDAVARQSAAMDRLTFWSRRLDPRELRDTDFSKEAA